MSFIDDVQIYDSLQKSGKASAGQIREILSHARELKGISRQEVLSLLSVDDQDLLLELFETARFVKDEIYGNRLVLFAPLYISNLCSNECLYCAFRSKNSSIVRKALNQEEIKKETQALVEQGHKRILLVAGESYGKHGLDYVIESIASVYSVKSPRGNIRRINVNIAPLSVEEFKRLHQCQIGTYQIFQETYHRETYKKLHLRGPKADFDYRLHAMTRAFEGGFEDVGVGILFGLYDWRFEILALLDHIAFLEKTFGVGPHTISLPRLEPALNSELSYHPPYAVNDQDFKKIIAVLRLAVPYTGMILSTRENASMRRDAFDLGISQISAGSKTNPGGYSEGEDTAAQFSLGDHRPLQEVISDMVDAGHIPSFCTGCYRLGRVGADFMDLAKPGLIKAHCLPNAMFTFAEYMYDFADEKLQRKGMALIEKMLGGMPEGLDRKTREKLQEIAHGKRDIYF